MVGVINHWDILAHPIATIRCFGWPIFFRALLAGQERTFLSLVCGIRAPTTNVPSLLERCISLELRSERIYIALSKALEDQEAISVFFAVLAQQENGHADLLRICRAAAIRGRWRANLFNPWQDYLPRLERQMDKAEAALSAIDSVEAALQLVIQIESSQINQVFYAALAASDVAFVKKLQPFRKAMERHMSYILDRLPELALQLAQPSRKL
jgi:hypothetical protein